MYLSKTPLDLTVIYYTSNYLETENPYFVKNTKKQLKKAIGKHPLITVSHKPMTREEFGLDESHEFTNVCLGDIGRSHRNIYMQILEGCKRAKTKYVAMAEDDILYSYEHFHTYTPKENKFAYDMQKLSLFTWGMPLFTFRTKRMVVNQLIAPREMLIEAMEERFARIPGLHELGKTDEWINSRWGDPGRYENLLGVTVREREEFYSQVPSIVFSHDKALGYEINQGKKKRLGDIRMIEIPHWGRAEDVRNLCQEPEKEVEAFSFKNKQKALWQSLAKKNSKYYINSDHGKGISDEKFEESGEADFNRLIVKDEYIWQADLGSILEIGCGTGRITQFMIKHFPTVIGIDISGEMIKKAKEQSREVFDDDLNFIESDGYTIPQDDERFDVVFSYLVFQHMKTKEMVESNFKEAFRVLKKGGIFKVRMRSDNVDKQMGKWWAGVSYTDKEAIEMAHNIGFGCIKVEPVEDYGFWLWLKK